MSARQNKYKEGGEPEVTSNGHKIYVVTARGFNKIKIGYTSSSTYNGVWRAYHRSFGKNLIIVRIFPAKEKLEDLKIHQYLRTKYNLKNDHDELYSSKALPKILKDLEQWFEHPGWGPFDVDNLLLIKSKLPIQAPTRSKSEGTPYIRPSWSLDLFSIV